MKAPQLWHDLAAAGMIKKDARGHGRERLWYVYQLADREQFGSYRLGHLRIQARPVDESRPRRKHLWLSLCPIVTERIS
jgi:hypothetical protein